MSVTRWLLFPAPRWNSDGTTISRGPTTRDKASICRVIKLGCINRRAKARRFSMFRYRFGSQVKVVPSNDFARDPDSRFGVLTKHRSVSPKLFSHATQVACFKIYLGTLTLWGLCIGQALLLQRSGIVLVPSIMRELHIWQIFPVGLALIAFLHSGYREQE